ncbi:hypothetical protein AXF42_Ash000743 [Apostasia shenzhenica]|uniref:Cystatin domain-containing protein n=1 Tax=Apostasia shenzhenica TaxID=1088818 RepID=A0A2I0AH82_9ASPA|nr:hypothetical protein AXF42_Ash000743 [Apostasia shenzhenica]
MASSSHLILFLLFVSVAVAAAASATDIDDNGWQSIPDRILNSTLQDYGRKTIELYRDENYADPLVFCQTMAAEVKKIGGEVCYKLVLYARKPNDWYVRLPYEAIIFFPSGPSVNSIVLKSFHKLPNYTPKSPVHCPAIY